MERKTVSLGSYTVTKAEDGKITVERFGEVCPNAKQAIRDIAEKADFEIDPKWNTQTAGAKLIKHLLANQEEVACGYLYLPGYQYDHDKFAEDVENEELEGYEDDWWGLMSDVERGEETAERVAEINLEKPGLYIKDLERRTYAYVFDGEIVVEYD